jgi:prolipoprotein diacylglyceryl transferase
MGLGVFIWDVDRVWFHLGPLAIRYYGLLIGLTVALGAWLVQRHLRRRGYSEELAQTYVLYLLVGFVVGARLGHCFFYHPLKYLHDPLEILRIWHGGIASHGAAIGLTLGALVFSRRHKVPFAELCDAAALAAAVGATFVRLGNFMNSEIVGRVTHVPWAVVFKRHDALPRHPSQLYEAAGGLIVLLLLLGLARRKDLRSGLLASVFLLTYFSFRFGVEFFKEYVVRTGYFTMGQYLSLPFLAFGAVLLAASLRRKAPRTEPGKA